MRLSFLLLVAVSMGTADSVVTIKTLVFPKETDTSVVELTPLKPIELRAFTLCMNVAMEAKTPPGRDIVLFEYRTPDQDVISMWLEKDGRLSLYLDPKGVLFALPQLGALETHMCLTWECESGATSVFLNGRKSVAKIYGKGLAIPVGGKVLLGQDADSGYGAFDIKQCFVGEISDLQMWDYVLPASAIQGLYSGMRVERGNVFDWERIDLKADGEVEVLTREL